MQDIRLLQYLWQKSLITGLNFLFFNHDSAKTHLTVPEAVDDEAGKAWQAGLEDLKELYEKGFLSENTNTATADEVFQSFLEGKSAFYVDGSWKMGGIKEGTDNIDNFTVTYVPGNGDRKAQTWLQDFLPDGIFPENAGKMRKNVMQRLT